MKENMKTLLDVITMGGAIIGASIIASNIGHNPLGYLFFTASSIAAVALLKNSTASKSLMVTQLFFIVINIIGFIRY